MDPYLTSQEAAKFQEVIKHHKNLEVVSVVYCNDFIQCLSELMYRPCFRQLTISTIPYLLVPFNGVHSLLSAFFLSPYPVTLKLNLTLDKVCLVLHSTDPISVLAINTEQQSKSLDVALYVRREFLSASPRILESNFLPQYIVLKSLRIMNSDALCSFLKQSK